MIVPKPLISYLCRFSLRAGALATGLTIFVVFAVCGAGGAILLSTWNSTVTHSALLAALGQTTDKSDLLERVYPEGLVAAIVMFLAYAGTAALLTYGTYRRVLIFVKIFIVSSVVVFVLCLIGHLYVFLQFSWRDARVLTAAIVVNSLWYVWWGYSFLVVLSYLVDSNTISPETSTVTA